MEQKNNVPTTGADKLDDSTHQKSIPLDKLTRFRDHAFEDYKGERLDVLIESIKVNGLIHQIAVRPHPSEDGKFEILSGHNRVAAARLLGWTEISTVIFNITDDEAILFVNEANVNQRRFENWLASEKSKSIYQFHEGIKKQGSRTDRNAKTSGGDHQKAKIDARKKTAQVYGVSENTVRLYLELYRLIEPLKKRLDDGNNEFRTTSAQVLSCVPAEIQELVNTVLEEDIATCGITVANAKKIRDEFKDYKITDTSEVAKIKDGIKRLLYEETDAPEIESLPSFRIIEMNTELYDRLFPGRSPEDVVAEIKVAVELYRNMGTDNTSSAESSEVP